ncbi:hypothetical protein V2G26_006017 [Clonostachys chloroleuca]
MAENLQMPAISNPDENAGPRILGAVATVTALAFILVIKRFYVRIVMIHNVGWDDALMALTIITSLVGFGFVVAQVYHGAGQHRGELDDATYSRGMKLNFIAQPIYLFAICFVKLSVGASLLRIATTKFYRYLILFIMGFMLFYTIGCFFTIIFQCTDIRVIWDPTVPSICWDTKTLQALSYLNVSLNAATDLLFAVIIPTPMLWKLNVHRRTRITLIGILGLGVFACAAAFVKVGYLINYGRNGDFLWDSRDITIWTATELNIGIIAGSLPCLRPLFRRFLGSTYGKRSLKSATTATIPAHGTMKGSKWKSLGSRVQGKDDLQTGSQEAINTAFAPEEFELHERVGKGNSQVFTTVVANPASTSDGDALSSPNSSRSSGEERGIKKTMVTTVDYSKTT